jgi:hypothetical protein
VAFLVELGKSEQVEMHRPSVSTLGKTIESLRARMVGDN